MSHYLFAGTIVALSLLVGCMAAMPPPSSQDQEPAPPPPTLLGTWSGSVSWEEHGRSITETTTLTFTETRFIEYVVRDVEGTVVSGTRSGSWRDTGSSVTKTYFPLDDETGEYATEATAIVKDYAWGDAAHSVLLIHDWKSDDESEQWYHRYDRMADPIPGGINGVWTYMFTDEDDGITHSWTFTFGDTFTDAYQETDSDGEVIETAEISGSMRIDTDNNYVLVQVERFEGADPESEYVGHELRYAYAPTGIPNKIALSISGFEQVYDDDTATWIDNEKYPYGEYWFLLERQADTTGM